MSSMPSPASFEGGGPGQPDGGGAVQLGTLRDEPVVVGVGAGEREDPTLLGHAGGAGGRDRAHDVGRALVDLHVGRAQLGVGERDHPVARPGRDDLVGRPGLPDPGVRVGRRHLAEARPQAADAGPVLGQGPAVGGPQRVLEEGVGMHREDDAALHLELGGARPLLPEQRGRWRALRLARPFQPGPGRVPAGQGAGVHRLGPGDEHDLALAPADGETGVVHEGLRVVAADGGDHQLGRLVALGEAEARRHQPGRVGGGPAQRRHDPDAVGPPEQGAPGRGRPARRGAVAVLCRRQQGRRHERQRLGPGSGVEPGVGRRRHLAHADHHGGSGVQRHGRRSVPADAPGPPRAAGTLGAVPPSSVEGTA